MLWFNVRGIVKQPETRAPRLLAGLALVVVSTWVWFFTTDHRQIAGRYTAHEPEVSAPPRELVGLWRLKRWSEEVQGGIAGLPFLIGEKGQVRWHDGCNRYRGFAEIDSKTLRVVAGRYTHRACLSPDGQGLLSDGWFLNETVAVHATGDELRLEAAKANFVYKRSIDQTTRPDEAWLLEAH